MNFDKFKSVVIEGLSKIPLTMIDSCVLSTSLVVESPEVVTNLPVPDVFYIDPSFWVYGRFLVIIILLGIFWYLLDLLEKQHKG